ncbi:MAG: queuosine precursor transporter [Mycoplasmatota bacterium]|nr:queuosine precursor transporter [Mycoplasmatota bacterium]
MRNIILILIEVIICYTSLLILYKKYRTDGIYVYGIIATFTSCIMSLKQIDLMGVSVPIGFGVTTTLIVAGNLITQKRGPEELKTYISLILITALISCCFLNLSGLMKSSKYNEIANKSYDSIFKYNLRVYFGLIISIILSSYLGSKLYYLLKRIQNKIVISNIFSIIIIELLENTTFVLIAYLFEYEIIDLMLCIVFRYMIKTIIGLLGTIPIYIANKIN